MIEVILNGAALKYPDGREVCTNTKRGKEEYQRRTFEMAERQEGICCLCKNARRLMTEEDVTFEHTNPRGNGGAWRDDRIVDDEGNPMNGAAHIWCNYQKGSKRAA